jgi:hypothetical protein
LPYYLAMQLAATNRDEGGAAMKALSKITDRALGHLGLFLIGAISWTADRLSMSGSESEIPTPVVPLRNARPCGAGRTGVTAATTPRVAA